MSLGEPPYPDELSSDSGAATHAVAPTDQSDIGRAGPRIGVKKEIPIKRPPFIILTGLGQIHVKNTVPNCSVPVEFDAAL